LKNGDVAFCVTSNITTKAWHLVIPHNQTLIYDIQEPGFLHASKSRDHEIELFEHMSLLDSRDKLPREKPAYTAFKTFVLEYQPRNACCFSLF